MPEFLAVVKEVPYECSFRSNPRVRFFEDRIENLDSRGKVTGTIKDFSFVEPGLGKIQYNSGAAAWFAFSDDLTTFAVANMEDIFECSGLQVGETFADSEEPVLLTLENHPKIGQVKVGQETITLISPSGSEIGQYPAFHYLPHAVGFVDENLKDGFLLLSREKAMGWWMEGNYIGAGVRTDKGGIFQLNNRSPLRNFLQRSVQFPKVLLRSGNATMATAQEKYASTMLDEVFKEKGHPSRIHGLKEIGMARANHLDREAALPWYEKAYRLASEHLASDPKEQVHYITLYGDGLADTGKFQEGLDVLSTGIPLMAKVEDVQTKYLLHEAAGKAEFGMRRYDSAINHFAAKAKLGKEANFLGVVSMAQFEIATCHRAAGNSEAAMAALDLAISAQEERQKGNPKANYDTYRLAFACAALERWDDALRFADLTNRRSSVTYQEYARLATLWNRGDTDEASELAKKFVSRFGEDMEEVLIRRDMDTMTVRLTEVIAEPSPETSRAFSEEWDRQKESLKNRPLENYFFALVLLKAREKMP